MGIDGDIFSEFWIVYCWYLHTITVHLYEDNTAFLQDNMM
jgi:hypothetical protein